MRSPRVRRLKLIEVSEAEHTDFDLYEIPALTMEDIRPVTKSLDVETLQRLEGLSAAARGLKEIGEYLTTDGAKGIRIVAGLSRSDSYDQGTVKLAATPAIRNIMQRALADITAALNDELRALAQEAVDAR
jgi:hypothetical protein